MKIHISSLHTIATALLLLAAPKSQAPVNAGVNANAGVKAKTAALPAFPGAEGFGAGAVGLLFIIWYPIRFGSLRLTVLAAWLALSLAFLKPHKVLCYDNAYN